DPTDPEMNCHLNDLYVQDYHSVQAPGVFDIRTDPPMEIRNGTIEYDLFYQGFFHLNNDPVPYPYSEYFIDSIKFLGPATVEINIFESATSKIYSYTRS